MPIYEYVCRNCGHELERLQRLSDEPLTQCPACDTPELKRKISAAGFRLAGGGWYETDFKSDGKRNIAGDDKTSTSSASSSSGESTKSDTATSPAKPAAADKKTDTASTPEKKTSTASSSKADS
ncbi:regulatory protein, FmdB family [Salinisphaera sp. S4-8]|uniref:FmdB family zinc ribbon protein n=1 Tax=Salinisphaera sp. S4-8 TaxID=633357 RepID=UPI0033407DA9